MSRMGETKEKRAQRTGSFVLYVEAGGAKSGCRPMSRHEEAPGAKALRDRQVDFGRGGRK